MTHHPRERNYKVFIQQKNKETLMQTKNDIAKNQTESKLDKWASIFWL